MVRIALEGDGLSVLHPHPESAAGVTGQTHGVNQTLPTTGRQSPGAHFAEPLESQGFGGTDPHAGRGPLSAHAEVASGNSPLKGHPHLRKPALLRDHDFRKAHLRWEPARVLTGQHTGLTADTSGRLELQPRHRSKPLRQASHACPQAQDHHFKKLPPHGHPQTSVGTIY